jgi:hypothetical protein
MDNQYFSAVHEKYPNMNGVWHAAANRWGR